MQDLYKVVKVGAPQDLEELFCRWVSRMPPLTEDFRLLTDHIVAKGISQQLRQESSTLLIPCGQLSHNVPPLMFCPVLQALFNNVAGELLARETYQVSFDHFNDSVPVRSVTIGDDVLWNVIPELIHDECWRTFVQSFQDERLVLRQTMVKESLDDAAAKLVRRQVFDLADEKVHHPSQMLHRDAFDDLLDHMVPVSIF